jgi:ubiquinone/menaquinone biosynthesis C-methylase UbiE
MEDNWRIWDKDEDYGKLFKDRAEGKLPEMESSKAVAKHLKSIISKYDVVMDVGCGAGHYLKTLDKTFETEFSYIGIDATKKYIEFAIEAYENQNNSLRTSTDFRVGDIFNLPTKDKEADIVMCNNVLLHLPSIKKPIEELCRSAKKYLVIRTLIGTTSFRVKHVESPEIYDENGEPKNFHFLNIYSKSYIESILKTLPGVKNYTFIDDNDYNIDNIGEVNYQDKEKPGDLTTIIGGLQVCNYIIQPWCFLIIEKS